MKALILAAFSLSFDLWPADQPDAAGFVAQVERQPQQPKTQLRFRILMFTADWCGPCQGVKRDAFPKLVNAGWRIGESPLNQIQVIDVDAHPELVAKWKVQSLPTFIRVSDGVEVRRNVGPLDAAGIGEVFYGKAK